MHVFKFFISQCLLHVALCIVFCPLTEAGYTGENSVLFISQGQNSLHHEPPLMLHLTTTDTQAAHHSQPNEHWGAERRDCFE